jgi:predicted Zn-dependent protease
MVKAKSKSVENGSLRSEQREKALEEYEKGIRLLQQRDFDKAVPRFQAVIDSYPGEVALCDRARTYLRIAMKKHEKRAPVRSTRKAEESFEVGVFLLNEGDAREAVRHLERAVEHEPQDAGVRLTLAAARLQAGDREGALATLREAVSIDGSSRYRARTLADFAELQGDERFEELVGAAR